MNHKLNLDSATDFDRIAIRSTGKECWHPKGYEPKCSPLKLFYKHQLQDALSWLEDFNYAEAFLFPGLYSRTNGSGPATSDSMTQWNGFNFDFQDADLEIVRNMIDDINILPGAVVLPRGFTDWSSFHPEIFCCPVRLGKGNRKSFLKKAEYTSKLFERTFQDVGIDTYAVKVNQAFRLPFIPRLFNDQIVIPEVIEFNPDPRYELDELIHKVKIYLRKKNTTYHYKKKSEYKTIEPSHKLETCKAMQWLNTPGRTFPENNRNKAILPNIYALAMMGINGEEAYNRMSEFHREHTPDYPLDEFDEVFKTAWKNPHGIDYKILLEIVDTNGETMSEETAKCICACMPRTRHYQSRPTDRNNDPSIESFLKFFSHFINTSGNFKISTGEIITKETGIKTGTYNRVINPVLKGLGITTTVRQGRTQRTLIRTHKIRNGISLHKLIDYIKSISGTYFRLPFDVILRHWKRHFKHILDALQSLFSQSGRPTADIAIGLGKIAITYPINGRSPPADLGPSHSESCDCTVCVPDDADITFNFGVGYF